MLALLRQELAGLPNLELVHGDILQLDPAALVLNPRAPESQFPDSRFPDFQFTISQSTNLLISQSPPPYIVVANLPYYITSAALRHLLEAQPPPGRLVLTVQAEVARRIVAGPGDMSLLAVSVQFYGRPQVVARIPAGAFIPPPQVDSAVLRIDTYSAPPVQVPNREAFFRVVRAGFGQKRKQLKNALTAGLGRPPAEIAAALARAGVDPQRRAETLSLAEWAALTREFSTLTIT
jgi:16S rRNA (adenine1518-N6/adenine1519-N6)-dimethyltransferase